MYTSSPILLRFEKLEYSPRHSDKLKGLECIVFKGKDLSVHNGIAVPRSKFWQAIGPHQFGLR